MSELCIIDNCPKTRRMIAYHKCIGPGRWAAKPCEHWDGSIPRDISPWFVPCKHPNLETETVGENQKP